MRGSSCALFGPPTENGFAMTIVTAFQSTKSRARAGTSKYLLSSLFIYLFI